MKKGRFKWLSYVLLFAVTFTGVVGSFSLYDRASTVHAAGFVDMHRMYNPNSGEHHYTKDIYEREHLISIGWKDEDIGWYSDDNEGTPLYRLYNPNATTGNHHYTTSTRERDKLIKLGWNDEGIGWYGY